MQGLGLTRQRELEPAQALGMRWGKCTQLSASKLLESSVEFVLHK